MFVIPIVSSLAEHSPAEADTLQMLEIIEPPVSRVGHLCFIIPHAKAIFMRSRFHQRQKWAVAGRNTGNTEASTC